MSRPVREAAELIIGNLNEDGYLIASDEELMGSRPVCRRRWMRRLQENLMKEAAALRHGRGDRRLSGVDSAREFSADWDSAPRAQFQN